MPTAERLGGVRPKHDEERKMAVDGIVVSVMTGTNTGGVSVLKVSGYLDTTTAGELEKKIVATGAWDKDIEAQFKTIISDYKATGSW